MTDQTPGLVERLREDADELDGADTIVLAATVAQEIAATVREAANRIEELEGATVEGLTGEAASLSAWQPIETAPKDGTRFWALEVHRDPRFRSPQYEASYEVGSLLGTLLSREDNPRCHNRSANCWSKPTHWQPLPPPPSSAYPLSKGRE